MIGLWRPCDNVRTARSGDLLANPHAVTLVRPMLAAGYDKRPAGSRWRPDNAGSGCSGFGSAVSTRKTVRGSWLTAGTARLRRPGHLRRAVLSGLVAVTAAVLLSPTSQPSSFTAKGVVWVAFDEGRFVGWVSDEYREAQAEGAERCQANVCIDVKGVSLLVESWSTQAFGNVGCSRAAYNVNDDTGSYVEYSPQICPDGDGPGVYVYTDGSDGVYKDGALLCNTWDRIAGEPCIEIQK